jgi:hypothetical protein
MIQLSEKNKFKEKGETMDWRSIDEIFKRMQTIYPSFPKKCVLPKCIPNSLKSK